MMKLYRRRQERGQATLEMIGIIPMFMLILGAIIQLFLIGYAAVSAEASARQAAREVSTGASSYQAEQNATRDAPGVFTTNVKVTSGNSSTPGYEPAVGTAPVPDAVSAKATYDIPFLGIGIKGLNMKVTRYVVIPRTD